MKETRNESPELGAKEVDHSIRTDVGAPAFGSSKLSVEPHKPAQGTSTGNDTVSQESSPEDTVTEAALDDGQPSEGKASVRFRTPGIMVSVRLRSTATRPTRNVRCAPAVTLPKIFKVTISVVRSYLAVTLTLADVAFT